jgi:hypothetical protein
MYLIWWLMLVLAFVYVLMRDPGAFSCVLHYVGEGNDPSDFDLHLFGAGLMVGIALILQLKSNSDTGDILGTNPMTVKKAS